MRWAAPTLYVAALSGYMWREGIPVGRERLLLWIVLGLLALSTANLGGWVRGVLFEWLPLALVLAAYDLLRGHADGLLFSTWYRPQLEADSFLFGGTVPTVWLQDRLWHGSANLRWYDYATWAVYMSYFVATYLRRRVALVLRAGALSPVRRLCRAARRNGVRDLRALPRRTPVAREPGRRARSDDAPDRPDLRPHPVPLLLVRRAVRARREYSNPVAAVPSLHAAYTLLITLFLWRAAPRWARPLLALYPLAMAFALVYAAEHYVVDILLGWVYTVAAVWIVSRIASRVSRRPT